MVAIVTKPERSRSESSLSHLVRQAQQDLYEAFPAKELSSQRSVASRVHDVLNATLADQVSNGLEIGFSRRIVAKLQDELPLLVKATYGNIVCSNHRRHVSLLDFAKTASSWANSYFELATPQPKAHPRLEIIEADLVHMPSPRQKEMFEAIGFVLLEIAGRIAALRHNS